MDWPYCFRPSSEGLPRPHQGPVHILDRPLAITLRWIVIWTEFGAAWRRNSRAAPELSGPALFGRDGEALESSVNAHSAIIGPLTYRRKVLGVIGLANGPASTPFSEKDLTVFKAIAEQSAFALYNEVVYLEAGEKKRLDHDLEIAREIQAILLPSSPPTVDGYELSGVNVPARQVSGDYYDYIRVDEHRVGVAIADVSGRGPASLIMAMCRSVIRSEAVGRISAAEVLQRVNQQLILISRKTCLSAWPTSS
jgi:hypothetical protein